MKSKHGGACFQGPNGAASARGEGFGFCFLENLQNPNNPTEDCFEDATWSKTAGRFWSAKACKERAEGPPSVPLQ